MSLLAVRVADGRAEAIPVGPWSFIRKPTWLSDKALILAAASPHMNRTHLIEVRLPDGQSHDIAGGLSDYLDLSVSQSGGRLVAVEQQRFSSVWITKLKSPEKSKQLTDAGSHYYGLSWAPDGKLFTQSEAAGRSDLVMIDERSGLAKSLTDDDSVKAFPEVSGDGKYLIYSSNRDGTFHLWRSDPDGRNPVRLTTDNFGEEEGVTTPDGNWVVFTSLRSGQRSLWKVPIGGGQPISITNSLSSKPAVSPDGKLIACEYVDSKTNTLQVAILRFRDGSLIRILHQVPALTGARLRWSRDGKSVYFVMNQNGIGNIWEQEINGGPAKQLTHYQEDEIFYIAVAPDGRSIACLRGKRISDAVLANIKTN
jgi:Tol biopolymer transport system component